MDYKNLLLSARQAIRLRRLICSLSRLITLIGAGMALLWLIAAVTQPGGIAQSVAGLIFLLIAAIAGVGWGLLPLLRVVPESDIIQAIETRYPELQERMSTAYYLKHQAQEVEKFNFSPDLVQETVRWTESKIGPEHFEFFHDYKNIQGPLLIAVFTLTAWIGIGLINPGSVKSAWLGYQKALGAETHHAQAFRIHIPGDMSVPRANPIKITAKVSIPIDSARLHFRTEGGSWRNVDLKQVNQKSFSGTLPAIYSPTQYFVEAKGGASSVGTISPVDPPRLEKFVFRVQPPAYTGLPGQVIEQPRGDLEATQGAAVEMTVWANNELAKATIQFGTAPPQLLQPASARSATFSFEIDKTTRYRLSLQDRFGNTANDLGPFQITARKDRTPQVFIHHPPLVSNLGDIPLVRLDWEAIDDYGLTRLDLHYQMNFMNQIRTRQLARLEGTAEEDKAGAEAALFSATSSLRGVYRWDLSPLELLPGDEVSYYLIAYDNDGLAGPKSATSEVHLLRLPTMMDMAQESREEETSYIDQLDDLLEQQKQIREDAKKIKETIEERKQQPADQKSSQQEQDSESWQQQQKMEQLKEEQEDIGKQVQQLQQEIQQTLDKMNQPGSFSMKTLQKMAKIEELLDQLMTDQMKQVMEQFNQVLDEMVEEQMAESMDELDLSIEEFEENLDRMLSLLENSMMQRQFEALLEEIEALKQEQDALSEETSNLESEKESIENDDTLSPEEKAQLQETLDQKQEELASRQQQVQERTENLLEQMQELARNQMGKDEKMAEGLQEALKQSEQDQLSQSMQDASENLQSGRFQQSQSAQQQASQALSKLQQNLSPMMNQMGGMDFQQDMTELRRTMDRALVLSQRQESTNEALAPGGQQLRAWPPHLQNEINIYQSYFRDEVLRIEEVLRELGKKDPFIDFEAIRELRLAARANDRAVQWSEEQLPRQGFQTIPRVRAESRLSLTHINQAILILLDNLESLAQAQASGNMQSYFNSMQQMIGKQQQINIRTRQLNEQKRQMGQTPSWREQMKQLAKEQAALRREMQELYRKYGKLEELLGNLDETGKQMMDVEKDLEDRMTDDKVQEKQERILSRMLDAEKSAREKGMSKERQSETASETEAGPSPDLPETAQTIRSRIQKLREGVGIEDVPLPYQQRVQKYFENLSREN